MAEGKPEELRSWWEKLRYYAGMLAVPAWLVSMFTGEEWFYLVSGLIALAALAVMVCSRFPNYFTYESKLVGLDHQPIKLPLFGKRAVIVAWVILVVVVVGTTVWYGLGEWLLPSASITRFESSNIRYKNVGDGKYNALVTSPNFFFLPFNEEQVIEERASRAVILTVARQGGFRSKSLRIESVGLVVEHVPFVNWRRAIGVMPKNVVMPSRFVATLRQDTTITKAQMIDENDQPTEGTIVLDTDNPFAEIQIEFVGNKTGLYRVSPEITVTDEKGKHRTKTTYKDSVLVAVYGDDAKEREVR